MTLIPLVPDLQDDGGFSRRDLISVFGKAKPDHMIELFPSTVS